jgi:hypothetical protein
LCRRFDSVPGHQKCKPLILNGVEGFCTSGVALAPWFGTPSRYTVTLLKPRMSGCNAPRRRSFMAQPFKHPDTGIYYLRRKVPLELQPTLGREYKRSLGTREPAKAKGLFAEEWARSGAAFALAKAQLAGEAVLTVPDLQTLATRWYHEELDKAERTGDFRQWIAEGPATAWEVGNLREEHTSAISLRDGLSEHPEFDLDAQALAYARRSLRSANYPMPPVASPLHAASVAIFREQLLALGDIALKRHEGDWSTAAMPKAAALRQEVAASPIPAQTKSNKLSEVFREYAEDRVLTDGDNRAVQKSNGTFGAAVAEFIDVCGDLAVSDITREHARQYRAQIVRLPSKGEGIASCPWRKRLRKVSPKDCPKQDRERSETR